jgi:hypothetical protein
MYKPDTYFGKHVLAVPTMVNTCQYNPIDGRISHKKKRKAWEARNFPITGPFETSELPQVARGPKPCRSQLPVLEKPGNKKSP